MRSINEIRVRLEQLRAIQDSYDYYGPFAKRLQGEIDALEWILYERAPTSYGRIDLPEQSRSDCIDAPDDR